MKYSFTFYSSPNEVNQYWKFTNNFDIEGVVVYTILKFIERKYDEEYDNYDYKFDGINLTEHFYDNVKYEIGSKTTQFSFDYDGIVFHQKNKNLILATLDEINLYKLYNDSKKYNL